MKLGLDFGSKNVHFAILDNHEILKADSVGHNGNIINTTQDILNNIFSKFGQEAIESIGLCGNFGIDNLQQVDPIVASVEVNKFLKTGCQTIISIGCEKFYLVLLDKALNYIEHSINPNCASGTGSFIDQQAERIGYSTEELSEKAYRFQGIIPQIATRCAVFAKSDIIHAQVQGYSKEAIAAGICKGVARSVLENIVKGRDLIAPILLISGVSQNRKIMAEIQEKLAREVRVVKESPYFNAIGSALLGKDKYFNISDMLEKLKTEKNVRKKLTVSLTDYPNFEKDKHYIEDEVEVTLYHKPDKTAYNLYIGIDVGSTSTKLVAMTNEKEIITGLYTRTKGEPVSASVLLLRQLKKIFRHTNINIKGVSTTGSGRNLIKEVLGADGTLNEISAHAYGTAFLDPEVDTIIEIGGQDSKFTLLKDNQVIHAAMNYVCAAGTGSFIEEQVKRLGIKLDEIAAMALGCDAPFTSDRCTVYMERDLNILQSEGWSKEQIITAVLYSVRDNYLSKVVGKTPLGKKIYFQGATAKNRALVTIFENRINQPIFVSKYCHLTGAIGAALNVMSKGLKDTTFESIDFSCKITQEQCKLCSNECNLTVYTTGKKKTAWGLKCGREYAVKKAGKLHGISRLEKKHNDIFSVKPLEKKSDIVIGIPKSVYMKQYHPLFELFFNNLGIATIVEGSTSESIEEGKAVVNSDFCAPINIAHGHIRALFKKNVDYIFFPTIVNEQSYLDRLPAEEKLTQKEKDCYFCYYSIYLPTIINNLAAFDLQNKLISPLIKFNHNNLENIAAQIAVCLVKILKRDEVEIVKAFLQAYADYQQLLKKWKEVTREVLSGRNAEMKILLLGRPYTIFDKQMNQGIPEKIESLGFEILHQSMLELGNIQAPELPPFVKTMHWYYGQQILLALEIMKKHENIYPVLLTCFRCSPDSYVITYFKEMMQKINKPYQVIQLDEHGSDVGYQTRIEAGLESFLNDFKNKEKTTPSAIYPQEEKIKITKEDTIFIAEFSPVLTSLVKMAYEAHGYKLRIVPVSSGIINEGYQYVSGGECMPNVAILGSIINIIKTENLDPKKCVFFSFDVCVACNFPQFFKLTKIACQNAGIENIRTHTCNFAVPDKQFSLLLNLDASAVSIIASILYKLYFKFSAYEVTKGDAQAALEKSLKIIEYFLNKKQSFFDISRVIMKGILFALLTNFDFEQCKPEKKKDGLLKKAVDHLVEHSHPCKNLLEAAKEIRKIFEKIPVRYVKKPRIAIIGDLYVKWNTIINADIYSLVEKLGGEIVLTSFSEYAMMILYSDIKENKLGKGLLKQMALFEKYFEKIFTGLIDESFEPDIQELDLLAREFGVESFIPGETEINIGRALYMKKHNIADAFLHLNPIFCCPGAVSASIFRKMQNELNLPIIDIFYDGTNKPNKIIAPHMYYVPGRERRQDDPVWRDVVSHAA